MRFYFHLGLNCSTILCMLAEIHGEIISLSTLKRTLNGQGLFRRKYQTDLLNVAMFIEDKISTTGNQQGYRWMHLQCLQAGMTVSRDTVSFRSKRS